MSTKPRPASNATRRKMPPSISNGATASITGRTSAAMNATWLMRGSGCIPARRAVDRHDRVAQGLQPVPFQGRRGVRPLASLQGRAHSGLARQYAGRSRRRKSRLGHPGVPEGRECGGGQRLLAMPRQRSQGAARWQTRPGHVAEHRDRSPQPRRLGGLLLGVPQPALLLCRAGAPSGQLRQMSHGSGPSADGDLLRVQARHRVPSVSRTS